MILPIYTVIEKIDYRIIEAAQDLGANSRNVFRKVIFPLSLPGVLSGITMSSTRTGNILGSSGFSVGKPTYELTG